MGKKDGRDGVQPLSLKFGDKGGNREGISCEGIQVITVEMLTVAMC